MKPFIKALEIWAPQKNPMVLEYIKGEYGNLDAFKRASETRTFAYNHGLPGRAWASGHPIILTDLQSSYFERSEAAKTSGISTAIAMPVFAGHFLLAVLVFLCGDDEQVAGAIELWHCDESKSHDLDLIDGYFGKLTHFEFLSRHTSFRRGVGLPGVIWESGMPKVLSDLGDSHRFIRSKDAVAAGITTGLGIPFFHQDQHSYVMTFLSALGTPIARQIELWMPTYDYSGLMYASGYAEKEFDLRSQYAGKIIEKGQGVIGRTFLTGMPEICTDTDEICFEGNLAAHESGMRSLVTFPVIRYGACNSVVALYL